MAATGRCSFELHERFETFSRELEAAAASASSPHARQISRASPSYRSPRDADKYPLFRTVARSENKLDRQTAAARLNTDATRSPYRAPSAHQFRNTTPECWRGDGGSDFVAKFTLPSNQDIRRRVARNQVQQ